MFEMREKRGLSGCTGNKFHPNTRYDARMKLIRSQIYRGLWLSAGLVYSLAGADGSVAGNAHATEKPTIKVTPKTLPDELTLSPPPLSSSQLMYQYLLSEIAGQRGIGDLAAQGMRDLAARAVMCGLHGARQSLHLKRDK